MFESLTKYLPQLVEGQTYGDWVIDRKSKGTTDDPIMAPFVDYGKIGGFGSLCDKGLA